ncbi:cytochrome b561 and DOMON domain-containing protein At4g12980-like [Benincasa hispida]|uniref:cytochrome b561 and DOMON domain-containing protein At4g12980-like n=1 Tax=Benincasa hispida TaxID=102211 RepID=UPI0018FF9ACB|nr:cytochrome b561 and DOMON domain-containing protein At4g12980-like [Benincasa hispida]
MHYHSSISFFILTILSSLFSSAEPAHRCTEKFHELVKGRNLTNCQRLPTLGAELGWSHPSFDKSRHVFQVLFGARMEDEGGWLAWGVNPGWKAEMVGTRAVIGVRNPDNGSIYCRTYNVSYETRIGCPLWPTDMEEIKCLKFEYDNSTEYHLITATLSLSIADYNVTRLNIVWQSGSRVADDRPLRHVANLKNVDCVETLDLLTGKSTDMSHLKIHLRQVHGVLNIIGWGTFLPIGAISARFFRKFPFECEIWWFYTHVGCQLAGFSIGVVGWGIGMWLAHSSPRYIFRTHHIFAIFIFVFATLQTLAIRFRPSLQDDFRRVWNIYHHFLGYSLLALIYINIFEGIKILKPENKEKWRYAVIGILIALGSITLILEGYTWRKFIHQKNELKKSEPLPNQAKPEEEEEGGIITQSTFTRRNSPSTPTLMDE